MDRVNFYLGHLNQISRAVEEFDAPVSAVHFRSLMDSFNRHFGTEQKYGFFRTDFLSEKRDVHIKRSGEWLQKFIRNRDFNPEKKDILFGRFSKDFLFGAGTSAFQHESSIR